jgi:hypothetical protein
MVSASQPRAAPSTVPIPPRTVEEPHFVDFDFDFGAGIPKAFPQPVLHVVQVEGYAGVGGCTGSVCL